MIGVQNQYIYSFSIGGFDDFINEEDLQEFTMIERAGNTLPEFIIGFNTRNEDIVQFMNEGNTLDVSYGQNLDTDLLTASLNVNNKGITKNGNLSLYVEASGFLDTLGYLNNSDGFISKKTSGVQHILDRAGNFFPRVLSNVDRSQDSQNWINYRVPMKKHLDDVWLHSDLGNGIPTIGISSDGTFILKDIRRELEGDPDFSFTDSSLESNAIQYDGDATTEDQTSFINAWLGYKREKIIYSLESATQDIFSHKPEPIISMTSRIAQNRNVSSRFSYPSINNDNVHPNYWKSYVRNITNLAALSSTRVVLSFQNRFVPLKVLDKVNFVDSKVGRANVSADNNAGNYFVTKISRSINNRQYVTYVELHRESLNSVKELV